MKEWIKDIFNQGITHEYMDETRGNAIADAVEKRICHLSELSTDYTPMQRISTEDDLNENVAEDYK